MSENVKLPEKPQGFLTLPREDTPNGDSSQMQDAEAQMRRALGLFGQPRRQDAERTQAAPAQRQPERFGAGGHKRRFVQDGEVPVTVLHGRREHPADAPTNRLEAAEAAAAAQQAAREKAERALAEAQTLIHDLQTKLGHANLAQTELQAAAHRDHDAVVTLRAELHEVTASLAAAEAAREKAETRLAQAEEEYAEEQAARLRAETAHRKAKAALEDAEQLMQELDLGSSGPIDLPARRPGRPPAAAVSAAPKPRAATRRAAAAQRAVDEPEPEPVQWWLTTPKKTRRR